MPGISACAETMCSKPSVGPSHIKLVSVCFAVVLYLQNGVDCDNTRPFNYHLITICGQAQHLFTGQGCGFLCAIDTIQHNAQGLMTSRSCSMALVRELSEESSKLVKENKKLSGRYGLPPGIGAPEGGVAHCIRPFPLCTPAFYYLSRQNAVTKWHLYHLRFHLTSTNPHSGHTLVKQRD